MSNEFEQPVEPMSRTEDLLRTGTEEPVIAMSEIEKILRGEHIDRPHSRVADLLLQYNPSDILIEKRIEENGTYYATADAADGYYKVVVDTPVIPPTVLEHLVETINTNGTHTFTPGTGVDGYSDATINVNVPANVTSRGLTVNGTFSSAVDNKDGYSNVTVNVQEAPVKTTSLSVTENGTYEPGPASELSLTIPTIPDEVETEVSAGATITNFDNLRIEFTNKTTGATGHVDIYPSAIAIQQIPMSFKNRTLITGPDRDHYITIVNGYDSIVVLQKGYTITAMKLTSYSGYFDEVTVNVEGGSGDIYKYHWSNDGKICVREGLGEYVWFFVGYTKETVDDIEPPEELVDYFPAYCGGDDGRSVIYGQAYASASSTTSDRYIGFYNNKIRTWNSDLSQLISGTFYGVIFITPDTDSSSNPQTNEYTSPTNVPISDITLIEKTITQNGTYSAEDDGYVGYSDVVVNVPPVGTVIPTIKLESTTTITTEVI